MKPEDKKLRDALPIQDATRSAQDALDETMCERLARENAAAEVVQPQPPPEGEPAPKKKRSKKRKQDRDGIYWRKDCHKSWFSYPDENGERQREPGSVNWDETKQMLVEALARVEEKKKLKPGELPPCWETFADVADRFLEYQRPRVSKESYGREEGIVNGLLKPFFQCQLVEVTAAKVSDYVTMRLGEVSKASVQKELISLKHLFNVCYDDWEILPENHPNSTRKIKTIKGHNVERKQHFSPDQFYRFLAASPEKYRPIFELLTATGMRRSELLRCRRGYVDQTRILLPTSKNGDPKEIHLNLFAQQTLAALPHGGPDDLLFPDVTPAGVSMAFHRVCELLGFSDIRLHDLRHTFGTWLRQGGVELDIIASQMGHRDLRMTKRYARVARAQVSQAVNKLDAIFSGSQDAENPDSAKDRHVGVTLADAPPDTNPVTH
jgi:integrase